MPFNTAPTNLFPAYTSDVSNALMPFADLSIDATIANPTTGDSRAILRGLIDRAYTAIQALPQADRPAKMNITRNNPQVVAPNTLRVTYTVSFDTVYANSALSMAPEA